MKDEDCSQSGMYPTLNIKEAEITFSLFWLWVVLAIAFGAITLWLINSMSQGEAHKVPFISMSGVAAVWCVAKACVVIARLAIVRLFGKQIDGVVCGYADDIIRIKGRPTQIVKILIQNEDGPHMLLYQTYRTEKYYEENEVIKLWHMGHIYKIIKSKGGKS